MVVTSNVLVMARLVKTIQFRCTMCCGSALVPRWLAPERHNKWVRNALEGHVRPCLKLLNLSYQHMNGTTYILYLN